MLWFECIEIPASAIHANALLIILQLRTLYVNLSNRIAKPAFSVSLE